MSEEEIKNIRGILSYNISPEQKVNLLKLLDLYNKEKEKNKELEKQIPSPTNPIPLEKQTNIWVNKRDYISKDKIKEYLNKMEKRCDKPKFNVMKKEIEEILQEGDK